MNILIDIGNTRLKWAVERNGILELGGALVYRDLDIMETLQYDWSRLAVPKQLCIASVAAAALQADIMILAKRLWPQVYLITPHSSASAFGVTNAYREPEKLGVDRWLALLAVRSGYPGAYCIACCGTAITVDVLTEQGLHLGGVISPGLQVMQKSLADQTAALPYANQAGSLAPADNTGDAIGGGTLFAAVGLIEAFMARLPASYRLLLTGGDAEYIGSHLNLAYQLDEKLIFKGLSLFCNA